MNAKSGCVVDGIEVLLLKVIGKAEEALRISTWFSTLRTAEGINY
jgi:hypothetical protein